MKLKTTQIGPLEARIIEKSPDTRSKTAIVFLHGAGASMDDLVPLIDYLPAIQECDCYFLNAPFEMMPGYPMYIWFNVGELVEKMAEKGFDEKIITTFVPTRINDGRENLAASMKEIEKSHDDIILIGFSQGGMMAFDYAIQNQKITKTALLSTSLCDYPTLCTNISKRSPELSVFQSHGKRDAVLPFAYGSRLKQFIDEHGIENEFHSFEGEHEIPLEILKKLNKFLSL